MTAKRAPRKRKESGNDVTEEFKKSYQKNFNCSNIQLRKMFPLTDNHYAFHSLATDEKTNVVFIDGVAGTMKTYLAVYSALELLKEGKADKIIYIRSVVESASRSIGALPGFLDQKFEVYKAPCVDKLKEILDPQTITNLTENNYIEAIPVNFVRGLTFNNAVVIADESQNFSKNELTTILTRFGRCSTYYIIGDSKQQDSKDSGFKTIFDKFDTEFSRKNNIHCMKFDVGDVMRSQILKHITQILGV